ncbi:MAG: hypothetical protein WAN28_09905 [Terracidiphilus sp.]
MNTQKIQSNQLETVLQNVHPSRRKVLAALVLAASAGLPCVAAPASASASTLAPVPVQMAANSVASFEVGPLLTWMVNEVSLLTSTISETTNIWIKIRPR